MTLISRTTVGGCTFDDIIRGRQSYACDNLVDLTKSDTVDKAKDKLIGHVHGLLDDIEQQMDKKVEKFYISKTYVAKRRKRAGNGFMTFDHMDSNTWKKNGISSRWTVHKKEDYGRDGMVVLATVPKAAIPKYVKSVHQEHYPLALEQKLLHHFRLTEADPRITNNTFGTGGIGKKGSVAYALYMAFRLSDDTEDTPGNDDDETEDIPSISDALSSSSLIVLDTSSPSRIVLDISSPSLIILDTSSSPSSLILGVSSVSSSSSSLILGVSSLSSLSSSSSMISDGDDDDV